MIDLYAIFRFQHTEDGNIFYTIRQLKRNKEGVLYWHMFYDHHSPTKNLKVLQEAYPNAYLITKPIQPNEQPLFDEKDYI